VLGSAPIAIVKDLRQYTEQDIFKHVVRKLGEDHRLAGVYPLEQIGLSDFPRNNSGKISKLEIETAMQRLR
jgi:acyl-coenzyme A synthetase/AMP-(fatty) acid ligase